MIFACGESPPKRRLFPRKQFLEVRRRQGKEEADQVERKCQQAKTRSEQEDEETAQTLAARRELTAEEQGELPLLWPGSVNPATSPIASPTSRTG